MFGISIWELVLIGVVLFLVVGPAKLPGLAKSIGQGLKDLRRSLNDIKGTVDKDDEFVKAVKEARQSVAEAREAVRSIFDDDGTPREAPTEDEADPAPRPVPRGRALVRPPLRSGQGESAGGTQGPSLEETSAQASFQGPSAVDPPGGGGGPTDASGSEEPVEAEVHRAPTDGVVPAGESAPADAPAAPRGSRGRRMVRPGRPRSTGGGSPTGSG